MAPVRIGRATLRKHVPLIALFLGFMVTFAACGGSATVESSTSAAADAGSDVSTPSAAELAAQNAASLTVATDPLDTEVLTVDDGTVASLRDIVTGDRPVLLWFYAPH